MCLAIPARVTRLLDDSGAVVDIGSVQKDISLGLVEGVGVGDYVIVHVGYALGRDAAIIGEVRQDANRFVEMETAFGGRRVVDWLTGEQLPRIC